MKKQVRKLTKKILILTLATSLVVTSCFSYKKIEAHAAAATATLGAWTLYEICLYFGTLAVSALGIGYAYENRDEIAEFGKSVIDSMTDLPAEGWLFGSRTADSSYVYGTEALQEVQDTAWSVIQGGGQSPKNDNDNDGDGDKDADDRAKEFDITWYFILEGGKELFNDVIKPIYDKWVNKEEDNILDAQYGAVDALSFNGFKQNASGNYVCNYVIVNGLGTKKYTFESTGFIYAYFYHDTEYDGGKHYICGVSSLGKKVSGSSVSSLMLVEEVESGAYFFEADVPVLGSKEAVDLFKSTGELTNVTNISKTYRIADWIDEDEAWKGYLEDISTSLRSLQDLTEIAKQLANGALTTQLTADAYGDMMVNISDIC